MSSQWSARCSRARARRTRSRLWWSRQRPSSAPPQWTISGRVRGARVMACCLLGRGRSRSGPCLCNGIRRPPAGNRQPGRRPAPGCPPRHRGCGAERCGPSRHQRLAVTGPSGPAPGAGGRDLRPAGGPALGCDSADLGHVSGEAVDVGGWDAMEWLARRGAEFGLCRVYANEPWHFELRPEATEGGCPPQYPDPSHDPRMSD